MQEIQKCVEKKFFSDTETMIINNNYSEPSAEKKICYGWNKIKHK